jgi:hypothetical protein
VGTMQDGGALATIGVTDTLSQLKNIKLTKEE